MPPSIFPRRGRTTPPCSWARWPRGPRASSSARGCWACGTAPRPPSPWPRAHWIRSLAGASPSGWARAPRSSWRASTTFPTRRPWIGCRARAPAQSAAGGSRADLPRGPVAGDRAAGGGAGGRLDALSISALAPPRGYGAAARGAHALGRPRRAAAHPAEHSHGGRGRRRRGAERRSVVRDLPPHLDGALLAADDLASRLRARGTGSGGGQHHAWLR